jgi:hypothetical protein
MTGCQGKAKFLPYLSFADHLQNHRQSSTAAAVFESVVSVVALDIQELSLATFSKAMTNLYIKIN